MCIYYICIKYIYKYRFKNKCNLCVIGDLKRIEVYIVYICVFVC